MRVRSYFLLSRVFTPGQHDARQHVAGNMLLVAGNKIVASLLTVCSFSGYKRIHVAEMQATCCRQQALTCCWATYCSAVNAALENKMII